MIRTLHTLVTTARPQKELLRSDNINQETNSPITHLELSRTASQMGVLLRLSSLGFQMACGVMVVTLCPHLFDLPDK